MTYGTRKKRKRGHHSPVIFKLYQFYDGKMHKIGEYRTNRWLNEKLRLYAEVMPESQVYLSSLGQWSKVEFKQERNEYGTLVEIGWDLVESNGIRQGT